MSGSIAQPTGPRFAFSSPRCAVSRSPSPCSTYSGNSSVRTHSPSLLSDVSAQSSPRAFALPFAQVHVSQRSVACRSPRASPTRSVASPQPMASMASRARAMTQAQNQAVVPRELSGEKSVPLQRPRCSSGTLSESTLDCVAGDVLFIRGSGGGLTEIGTTGGYFGHFLVVVAAPERLTPGELQQVHDMNGKLQSQRLWKVLTVESTRSHRGLHKSHMVIYLEPTTGCIQVVAEFLSRRRQLVEVEQESVQLWQSPQEIRSKITEEAVKEVLYEMKSEEQNWSLATAAKAVIMESSVQGRRASDALLKELKACWLEAPICTSIVVIFWQRLFGLMAPALRASHAELVLRHMPLKADRGLPGELICTLATCGWSLREHMTCAL